MQYLNNKTRAEELQELNQLAPQITPGMANAVSAQRKEAMEGEIAAGTYREQGAVPQRGGYSGGIRYEESTLGLAVRASSNTNNIKTAQSAGGQGGAVGSSGGSGFRGPGGTVRQVPEVYSPLWLQSNLNLPRDRATVNAWSRSFFALNPIVQNAISLHSTYPISKLSIKCKDPKIERFFSEMIEEIDLMNVCVQIAQEYWTLGEAFIYAELNDKTLKWSRLAIQNPDYITVKRSVTAGESIISLRPDENLKNIVQSNRPSDIQQRKQLDPSIIEHVKRGENIPLNNFYVSHLARRISPYEVRGTGLIVSCFRYLMLWDKLYESKFAQADSMINPLSLIKIGGKDFHPTPVDLEQWRDVFEAAENDKNFKIITHSEVDVQRIGYGSGIYDIANDITQIIKLVYIGLMVPSVIMDGSDTTYATGSVALDVLRQRYMQFRNMLSDWLKRKIFAPISQLNEFYERVDGKKKLIIPEIDFNHMSLFDMSDQIQHLTGLANSPEPGKNKVSIQTLYRSLGLEYEDELRKMRYEDIQDAIRQKELLSLSVMDLNKLRALGPNDEIDEYIEPPIPGEDSSIVLPGQQAPGGPGGMPGGPGGMPPPGGGMGAGGLPPLPGGPPSAPMGAGGPGKPSATPPPAGNSGVGPGGSLPPPPS